MVELNLASGDAMIPWDEFKDMPNYYGHEYLKIVDDRMLDIIGKIMRRNRAVPASDPSGRVANVPAMYILEAIDGLPIIRGVTPLPKEVPWVDISLYLKISLLIVENPQYRLVCNGSASQFGNPQDPILGMQFSTLVAEYGHHLIQYIDTILTAIFDKNVEHWVINVDRKNMVYQFSIKPLTDKSSSQRLQNIS